MSDTTEINLPDIGDFGEVEVIEVLVAKGDEIEAEQSLITVESDKASMEIPAPQGGVVKSVEVKVGDKIKQGSPILKLESSSQGAAAEKPGTPPQADAPASKAGTDEPAGGKPRAAQGGADKNKSAAAPSGQGGAAAATAQATSVVVPDIGDATDVEVIEIMVAVGDTIAADQSLITVESDKASMEIPAPQGGVVTAIKVKMGDKVSAGSEILEIEGAPAADGEPEAAAGKPAQDEPAQDEPAQQAAAAKPAEPDARADEARRPPASEPVSRTSPTEAYAVGDVPASSLPHASPSVRKFARELGVDLKAVTGSGAKDRITKDDVRQFVKQALSAQPQGAAGQGAGGLSVLPWPKVDFSKFGQVESRPLSRIQKISGANLHRNWVMIPHVTNNDQADITELEALRVKLNKEYEKSGVKVTMLAFLVKAVVAALKKYPQFNASLDGDNLILKQYFHVGFAADTPNGLVVPVIRDADQKGILDIARETAELAGLARDGKLSPGQMQGGCFSISSLGGIGGTTFTPIINAPEVAILGVSRSAHMPVWDGKKFRPRLTLPVSLSYDHRVIDGATAARFNAYLCSLLADFRRIAL